MEVLFRGGPLDGQRRHFDRTPATYIQIPKPGADGFGALIYRVAEQISQDLVVYEFADSTQ